MSKGLIGRDRWTKKSNVLLIGVNDAGFHSSFSEYLQEASDVSEDSYVFGFGTDCREMEFDENGFITSPRGGLGGEVIEDQPVEYSEIFDEEEGEFIDVDERTGGIPEEYALYDAINQVIATAVRRCDTVKDNITLTIMTDRGVDFGSNNNDASDIRELIGQMKALGWKINLLTSEIDASIVADKLGISNDRAYKYSCEGDAIDVATQMI